MSVYKEAKTNTWKVYYRYTDAHLFPTTQTDMASKLNSFRGEVI